MLPDIRDLMQKWHAVRRFWYAFRLWLLPLSGGAEVAANAPEMLAPPPPSPVLMQMVLCRELFSDMMMRTETLSGGPRTGRSGAVGSLAVPVAALPLVGNRGLETPDQRCGGAVMEGFADGPFPWTEPISLSLADSPADRQVWKRNGR